MYQSLKNIALSPLVSGSFLIFAGGLLASFFNFIFTILMNRSLSVENFGILISLISLITLLTVPSHAITPTIVTVAGRYFAHHDKKHLHAFYKKIMKGILIFGVVQVVFYPVYSKSIQEFIKIDNSMLIAYSMVCVGLFYVLTLNNSLMQAKLSFKFLSFSNAITAFLKAFLAFGLVALGFSTGGAIIGFLLSILITIFIGIYYFRDFIFYKSEDIPKISFRQLLSYGIPSAVIMLSASSLISSDILMVKHLFNPHDAGLYAGLSLVGKVIFFLSAPIGTVMFPIIVKRIESKENFRRIMLLSMALVGALSMSVTSFYYLFPEFSILFFLKRDDYLVVSDYLFRFSIFISLYAFVSLVSFFFLSIKKVSFSYIILAGAVLQIVLIYFFHANFTQVINASIISCLFILVSAFFMQKFNR